jgi:hypothetical protein
MHKSRVATWSDCLDSRGSSNCVGHATPSREEYVLARCTAKLQFWRRLLILVHLQARRARKFVDVHGILCIDQTTITQDLIIIHGQRQQPLSSAWAGDDIRLPVAFFQYVSSLVPRPRYSPNDSLATPALLQTPPRSVVLELERQLDARPVGRFLALRPMVSRVWFQVFVLRHKNQATGLFSNSKA